MENSEPFGHQLASEKIDAGRVSFRPADARDQTRLDWVLANAEDNWDGRGRGFGRAGSGWAAWYSDDRNPAAGQVGGQFGHAIVLTLCPTIFDRDVLPFDKARFVEAFAERGQIQQVGVERTGTQETNHWHRRLLRARRERPCGHGAAEQRDERAASCMSGK